MKKLGRTTPQGRNSASPFLTLFLSLSLLPLMPSEGIAQPQEVEKNPRLQGTIDLVPTDQKRKEEPYGAVQESAASFLNQTLEAAREAATTGINKGVPAPSENVTRFLTAAYYYCSQRVGTCEPILRSIYEAELLNSRKDKKVSCPILTSLWKQWLAEDMERRLQYSVQTAFINATAEFKRATRPRYLKCTDSLAEELSLSSPDKEFFAERYRDSSDAIKALTTSQKLLGEIKEKLPNLFHEIGLK